jgi:hypothetical protein
MNTLTTSTVKTVSTLEKLVNFVNQRPGLDFANYGDVTSYRSEMREITNDRNDFFEMLSMANIFVENLESKLTDYLSKDSGRLTIDENSNLSYCTGQYFPIEYRPAACRVLRSLIWNALRDAKNSEGTELYKTGDDIRKVAKRYLSLRVSKNYFN